MRLSLLALIPAFALGGCITTSNDARPSVAGSECKVFQAPTFVVRGARPKDDDWIKPTIEAGIAACGWDRPKAERVVRSAAKRSWGY